MNVVVECWVAEDDNFNIMKRRETKEKRMAIKKKKNKWVRKREASEKKNQM